MINIKACLFDLDGVIVDTAKYHYLAWRELANQLGFDFTESDNERLKGVSRMASLDILLSIGNISLNEEQKLFYADKKNSQYVTYIEQMNPNEILPGVLDFLDSLKKAGIKTAIGSASKNAPTIINRLKLASYFDSIIDGNKVSKAKPDPEVFLKGAAELGISPDQCVVFEDAVSGVEAALNGGMRCIGVGNPAILKHANFVIPGFVDFSFETLVGLVVSN